MNTFLPPDRIRALLGTPGPTLAKINPPPAKTTRGIPRGALLSMREYMRAGHSEKSAALLAGIPAGSASYAGKLVKGLR